MPSSHTCLSCNVVFENADLQRSHYKTEWHRYNLKRKVAELPAVTEEEFAVKAQLQTKKKEDRLQEKSTTTLCKACNKSFSNEKSFQNHINSKKHKDLLKKSSMTKSDCQKEIIKPSTTKPLQKKQPTVVVLDDEEDDLSDDDDDWEDVSSSDEIEDDGDHDDDEESEAIPPKFCLFCPHESVNIENNLRHMSKSHSFFIPDFEYILDLEALLVYLGAKVGDGKVCLLCNTRSRQFHTLKACRDHMTDKGHCMLNYETDAMLEFADFYDYSSSYPDQDIDTEEEISQSEGAISIDADTLELVLPSGARAGHRALKKYYTQNIIDRPDRPIRSQAMLTGLSNHYRAIGLTSTNLAVAIRRKLEAKKVENIKRNTDRMQLGVKANKFQTYFRKQVMYAG